MLRSNPLRSPGRTSGVLLLLAAVLSVGACGDDDEETLVLTPPVLSFWGPDSLAAGSSLSLGYSMQVPRSAILYEKRLEALDDSTFALEVIYHLHVRYEDGPLAPDIIEIVADSVRLESAPAREFRVVNGALSFSVQGDAAPMPGNRLVVELQDPDGAPIVGQALQLYREGELEPVLLPATDEAGLTFLDGACAVPGTTFGIQPANPAVLSLLASGVWPGSCSQPWHLVAQGWLMVVPRR